MNVEFLCRYETGTAVAAQPDELARVDWYEPATLYDHPAVPPWTAAAIERAEQRRQQLGW